jgi:hypothetical protein
MEGESRGRDQREGWRVRAEGRDGGWEQREGWRVRAEGGMEGGSRGRDGG